MLVIKGPQGRINRAIWGPLNKTIISAGEDAVIRIWDSEVAYFSSISPSLRVIIIQFPYSDTAFSFCLPARLQTGKMLKEEAGHKKTITSLAKSADGSHFLTGSLDKSAKVSITILISYFLICYVSS